MPVVHGGSCTAVQHGAGGAGRCVCGSVTTVCLCRGQMILLFLRMACSIKSLRMMCLMTGIFLDQHEEFVGVVDGLAMGKSLLNMFSYTAAFSSCCSYGRCE